MRKDARVIPNTRLAEERLHYRWSQRELADRIGTTPANVSRWERGITAPGSYFRQKLCAVFNKEPADLGLMPAEPVSLREFQQAASPFLCDPIIPSPQQNSLIGRTTVLEQVISYLCGCKGKSYAIAGLPGVGKTALAIAVARHAEIRQRFPDGVLWASLGPAPQLGETLRHWGALLQLNYSDMQGATSPDAWARLLHQQMGERRMLLILDDAWDLANAVATQVGGNQCAYLLTTRIPRLAHAFAGEQTLHLHELTEAESLIFLQQLAPNVIQQSQEEIQCLVNTVGGLPLALTLLGRYLHTQSLSGSARRLARALQSLCADSQACIQVEEPLTPWIYQTSSPAGTAISMRSAIDLSVRALPAIAQDAFYTLALFPPKPATFSEESICVVGNISPETLDLLVDSGLVESDSPGRYHIHPTIAAYARLRERARTGETNRSLSPPFRSVLRCIDDGELVLHAHQIAALVPLQSQVEEASGAQSD